MKDLKIIIPVHKYDDNVKTLLQKAIDSIDAKSVETVVISCPNGLKAVIEADFKTTIIEGKTDQSDFATLVNQAVGGTKWFSILEYDDTYTSIWFDEVEKYMAFKPETSVFLPLEDLYDATNGNYIGFGNEAPWASSFSEELGYIDAGCLTDFFNFYMTGGIFNTDDWEEVGGLKPSIKLTFWYEFLLRATDKGKKIFVIPKIGYIHNLGNPDSLLEIYRATIDEKESNFWYQTAKQEYFYKNDRNKTYQPTEE